MYFQQNSLQKEKKENQKSREKKNQNRRLARLVKPLDFSLLGVLWGQGKEFMKGANG